MFPFPKKKTKSPTLYPNSLSGDRSNRIRILTILPGNVQEELNCNLHETRLQDSTSYKALSYSWKMGEDDDGVRPISCNKVVIDVSCNLHSALRQLRHERVNVDIWVDSVCINQKDDFERTCQVGMMRDIYTRSVEVIIWLGESGPKDHLGEMLLPVLTIPETASLYQWFGDSRDLPKLATYVSREVEEIRTSVENQDTIDIFGAFCMLTLLASGVKALEIRELRHLHKSGPILRGFDALMEPRWVS